MQPNYGTLVKGVIDFGRQVPSRHGFTMELLGITVQFWAGEIADRPGINRALGYMEFLQLMAGVYDLDALMRVAPKANHGLFTPQMAYGPRIKDQLPQVLDLLKRDPNSRQAILFIGSGKDGPTNDQPCTSTIQFLLRDGRLVTLVNMRSWDLIKGLSYDLFMFGGIALFVAKFLGVPAGEVSVRAGSAHTYDSDAHRYPAVKANEAPTMFLPMFPHLGSDGEVAVGAVRNWALKQIKDKSWLSGPPAPIVEYQKGRK